MSTTAPTCPWRLTLDGVIYFCKVSPNLKHSVHTNLPDESPYHGLRKSWTERNDGAFNALNEGSAEGGPVVPASPALIRLESGETIEPPERYRLTPVGRCANQACPNQAHEGKMAVLTAFARGAKAARDVALILCAPCAEYLRGMLK